MDPHLLDNAVWSSLSGPHAIFAETIGRARRYPMEISPFGAVEDQRDLDCWNDLHRLIGPGGTVVLTANELHIPDNWEVIGGGTGQQMTGEDVFGEKYEGVLVLGVGDVPEMLDLIALTQPGPFTSRTVELGQYVGFRVGGQLVAMAGCRMNPQGWVEISAVCTHPSHQRQGLAARMVRAVVAGMRTEANEPFLHVSAKNVGAIGLYEKLGFRVRMKSEFRVVKAPNKSP